LKKSNLSGKHLFPWTDFSMFFSFETFFLLFAWLASNCKTPNLSRFLILFYHFYIYSHVYTLFGPPTPSLPHLIWDILMSTLHLWNTRRLCRAPSCTQFYLAPWEGLSKEYPDFTNEKTEAQMACQVHLADSGLTRSQAFPALLNPMALISPLHLPHLHLSHWSECLHAVDLSGVSHNILIGNQNISPNTHTSTKCIPCNFLPLFIKNYDL
jgi:hypothetical protein